MRPVIIPDLFFTDLLPQIDDLAELKLTLHCFWLLNEQSGELRYLRGDDLRSDARLLASLDAGQRPAHARTQRWKMRWQRAVARNTLLRLEIDTGPEVSRIASQTVTRRSGTSSTPSRDGRHWR